MIDPLRPLPITRGITACLDAINTCSYKSRTIADNLSQQNKRLTLSGTVMHHGTTVTALRVKCRNFNSATWLVQLSRIFVSCRLRQCNTSANSEITTRTQHRSTLS